jgi:hypothetical protein
MDRWPALAVGRLFRPVNRADHVAGEVLSEKVVWQLIKGTRRFRRQSAIWERGRT